MNSSDALNRGTSGREISARSYFDGSLDLYAELDARGVFLYLNKAWEHTLGYATAEIVGHSFRDFLHPDDIDPSAVAFDQEDPPEKGRFRNRYRHKNGGYVTLQWSGHLDPHQHVTYAHARDVTDEKRRSSLLGRVASIQETYMHHGTNKRGLFDQVLSEILKATESRLGFIGEIRDNHPTPLKTLAIYARSPTLDDSDLGFLATKSVDSGEPTIEERPSRKMSNGTNVESFFAIPLHYLGEHIGMIGVMNREGGYDDAYLAELKPVIEATASVVGLFHAAQRENALRERFMVVVENLPIMLTEFGPDGRIMWANKFYREKVGFSEAEIASKDHLEEVVGDEEKRARSFMLSGQTHWADFTLRGRDGSAFQSTWTNIRLKDGRAIGIGQDISERRLAEAMMIQSSKMASLGEMSAGVSHEINNPLAIIQGSAFRAIENLNEITQKRDDVEGDLNRIIQNCDRIARIVRGLRAFSRSAEHEPFIPTPIASVIEDVLNLAHERFKSQNIDLNIKLDGASIIDCRPVQLGQVLMNLLNNAYDAVSELKDRPRAVWVEARTIGENIEIAVEDSGHGIPPAVQNRILEPFFTTKDVGKGTGLGLSISKGIVDSHNGHLWLDTKSKRTRFVIQLPIRQSEA